jgi:hypothetical protein
MDFTPAALHACHHPPNLQQTTSSDATDALSITDDATVVFYARPVII